MGMILGYGSRSLLLILRTRLLLGGKGRLLCQSQLPAQLRSTAPYRGDNLIPLLLGHSCNLRKVVSTDSERNQGRRSALVLVMVLSNDRVSGVFQDLASHR